MSVILSVKHARKRQIYRHVGDFVGKTFKLPTKIATSADGGPVSWGGLNRPHHSRILRVALAYLELLLMFKHIEHRERFLAGQLLEIISLDRHLALADSLRKSYHSV